MGVLQGANGDVVLSSAFHHTRVVLHARVRLPLTLAGQLAWRPDPGGPPGHRGQRGPPHEPVPRGALSHRRIPPVRDPRHRHCL